MKLYAVFLLFFCGIANSAVHGGGEVICNYALKTVLRNLSNIESIPTQSGQVAIPRNGDDYGPAEIRFGQSFRAVIDVSIKSGMTVSAKVFKAGSSAIVLGHAKGVFRNNEVGAYQGGLELLSNEVSTLAEQEKITFDEASKSEKLPFGFNFVNFYLTCF